MKAGQSLTEQPPRFIPISRSCKKQLFAGGVHSQLDMFGEKSETDEMTQFGPDDFERNWLWLAADQTNSLALFQSFGIAPLPGSMTRSVEDAEAVDEFIAADLLPRVGTCESRLFDERAWYVGSAEFILFRFFRSNRWASEREGKEQEKERQQVQRHADRLLRTATCGVHIFEVRANTYAHAAYPTAQLKVDQLPEAIQKIVTRIRFARLTFQQTDLITELMISELR